MHTQCDEFGYVGFSSDNRFKDSWSITAHVRWGTYNTNNIHISIYIYNIYTTNNIRIIGIAWIPKPTTKPYDSLDTTIWQTQWDHQGNAISLNLTPLQCAQEEYAESGSQSLKLLLSCEAISEDKIPTF